VEPAVDENRWENVGRIRGDYRHHSPSVTGRPLEAFLEVSARCNLRCRMCPIVHDTRYRRESGRPALLTPEVFSRLRPIFPTLLRAYLYGLGEPLINPHLCRFIAELANAGVEACFTTNATLIDEKKADEIARVGTRRVSISIDGSTRETYETIRRGARWEDLVRGLRTLADARERYGTPELTVNFVAMSLNVHELPDMVGLLEQYDIRELNVEPLLAWDSTTELEAQYRQHSLGSLDRGDAQTAIDSARSRAQEAGIHLTSFFLVSEGSMDYKARVGRPEGKGEVDCSEPWTTIFVTTKGEVRTCCLNETNFGELRSSSIEEIWTGGDWADFRREHCHGPGTPIGCGFCIANGRSRISPLVRSVEPVSFRPFQAIPPSGREPKGWLIVGPEDGATITDPILITGCAPKYLRFFPRRVWWRLLPDIIIGSESVASLGDAIFDGRDFALILQVPYLSEGDHVVSLAMAGRSGPGWCRRTVRFWRPDDDLDSITTGITLAIEQSLQSRAQSVEVSIDGNHWGRSRWYCSPVHGRWRGITVIDVADLEIGRHQVTVHVENHTPLHCEFQRVNA
jgi:MoaA/NifB/PqqE/SkfB family radical SAM enzyme